MSSVLVETNSAFGHLNCVAGGRYYDDGWIYSDQVLSFNTDTNTWYEVGRMKNGREFHGGILDMITKKTGIKVKQSSAYSPLSNGGIERKHGAIDLTIGQMMEDDSSLKLEEALMHAVWARNIEVSKLGFSPY